MVKWDKEQSAGMTKAEENEGNLNFGEKKQDQQENRKLGFVLFLRHYWILHLSVAIGLIILLNLSLWQFDRLEQKLGLIERAQNRVNEPPRPAPGPSEWANLTNAEIDYLPVEVAGQFIMGELFYFDTLTNPKGMIGGQGYFIFSPFITDEGWILLVNRGFVPREKKEFSTRLGSSAPRGPMVISGLARRAESASIFSASADVKSGEWFVREPKPMAESLGLDPEITAPYTLDLQESLNVAGALPQAGETRMTFTNNHLQYAYTWAGLALALLGIYFVFLRRAWQDNKRLQTDTKIEFEDELN